MQRQQIQQGRGRPHQAAACTVFVGARLPEDLVQQLRELGDGNISAGIRRMAEMFNKAEMFNTLMAEASADVKQTADVKHAVVPDVKQSSDVKHSTAPDVKQVVPAPQQPVRAVPKPTSGRRVAVPRATQMPRSITSWSEDEDVSSGGRAAEEDW